MLPFLIKAKDLILDIFFPPNCLQCGKYLERSDKIICDDCYSSIKLNNTSFCSVCRARLPNSRKICHRKTSYLLAAAINYDEPVIQNLLHYFKYKGFEKIAPLLGEVLIKYLEDIIRNSKLEIRNFVVVPIPLHFWRERQRGFNQAKLLAEILARHFNLELKVALKRTKNNKPQVKLKNNEERLKNMAGCFRVENPDEVRGKNIILVDDVFTSGATMNEAVKTLKAAGAKRIVALTVAKA
jgi:ComF family protein